MAQAQHTQKPFEGPEGQTFESFSECVETLVGDGTSEEDAKEVCGAWQADYKDAEAVLTDLDVDIVSAVGDPAVTRSQWVIAKSKSGGGGKAGVLTKEANSTPLLVDKDDSPKQKAWAAVLIPDEVDAQGDLISKETIEEAAHEFLKVDVEGLSVDQPEIDSDHDLMTGKGSVIESWTLKSEQSFDLPSGGSESYPEGTWMLGVEFEDETWERIEAGELQGFSIYGEAIPINLKKEIAKRAIQQKLEEDEFVDPEDARERAAELDLEGIHWHETDDGLIWMPGGSHDEYQTQTMSLEDYDPGELLSEALDRAEKEEPNRETLYQMLGEILETDPENIADAMEAVVQGDYGDDDDEDEEEMENALDELKSTLDDIDETTKSVKENQESIKERVDELEDGLETVKERDPEVSLSDEQLGEIAEKAAELVEGDGEIETADPDEDVEQTGKSEQYKSENGSGGSTGNMWGDMSEATQ